ncbi:MAG TPA: SDR family NAD(P)-dependent oxidoreductase [Candidatus Limnocylindrales bacterium]|nr:SDR family NAD(P)-dependent oxidoreductase [Candidatus Limnocylindrales bacterium]
MTSRPAATGSTALVTGATSGIGRALAEALAAAGMTVGFVARDRERGEQTKAAIAAETGSDRVELFVGDLSDMASVRRLAAAVADAHPMLDMLIHSAAVYRARRTVTGDGFETMFATNVLGPFLLTNMLLERLRCAGSARVLVLSAPSTVTVDFDDLQAERRFRSLTAFGATKAADLLFTFELARRLDGTGVTANAVHPGLVRTNLMRQAPAPLRWATRLVSASPDRAAAAIAPLALAPEYASRTGRFFRAGREIEPPPYTVDPEMGRRLWEACAALTQPYEGVPS